MDSDRELGLAYFDDYFAYAPAALALRECVRLAALEGMELPEPILDVGCGDGIFARICYPERQVWGIDINPQEIRRAQATAAYSTLICGSITSTDLPANYFKSAIANCSLEHVPDIDGAFGTIARALTKDAPFVLIVPTPRWTAALIVPRALEQMGLGGLAQLYRSRLDEIFHHVHLYDDDKWREILARAGFRTEKVIPIVSSGVTSTFDLLLYPSVSGWLTKQVTGRWTLMPGLRRAMAAVPREIIRQTARALSKNSEGETDKHLPGEYLIVARKN